MHADIPPYVFLIFIAATAAAVVMQAGILLGMFIALRKTQQKVETIIDDARVHLLPTIASSRSLVEDLGPKLRTITQNLVETTTIVRDEAENLKGTVDDIVGRTREQAVRVDGMVTGTLNGMEHAATTIQHGIGVPMRKIAGIVAGIRAGVDVLRRKPAAGSASRYADEQDADFFE
jgi:hypothetical protein